MSVIFGIHENNIGAIAVLLCLLVELLRKSISRKLSSEVGGHRSLLTISSITGFVFMLPMAALYTVFFPRAAEIVAENTSIWAQIGGIALFSIFVVVGDFYVEPMVRSKVKQGAWVVLPSIAISYLTVSALEFAGGSPTSTPMTFFAFLLVMGGIFFIYRGGQERRPLDSLPLYVSSNSSSSGKAFWYILRASIVQIWKEDTSRKIFIFLCANLLFMLVEFSYGIFSNSLGLISDAFHMLFDSFALAVGLAASVISKWEPSPHFTYGWGRLTTLSGFANGIFLLCVGFFVLIESIQRFFEPPEIKTERLVLISVLGFIVNMVGLYAFHDHHGHSHGDHGHAHGGHGKKEDHGHSHGISEHEHGSCEEDHDHGHSHGKHDDHGHSHGKKKEDHGHSHSKKKEDHGHSHSKKSEDHGHSHGGNEHDHDSCEENHDHDEHGHSRGKKSDDHGHSHGKHDDNEHSHGKNKEDHGHSHSKKEDHGHAHGKKSAFEDIEMGSEMEIEVEHAHDENMQGIFLHVLADALGSVGVIISSLIIYFFNWKIADPICSSIISVMILLSTFPLLKSAGSTLLQASPKQISSKLRNALRNIPKMRNVIAYRNPHFWTLSKDVVVGTIEVIITNEGDDQLVLSKVTSILTDAGVSNITVQIERENAQSGFPSSSHFSHISNI